jgi:hypothetical protein
MAEKMDDIAIEHVIDLFEKKNFKKQLIKKLNENIDIPIINEKTEQKVLDKIYDVTLVAIKSLNKSN